MINDSNLTIGNNWKVGEVDGMEVAGLSVGSFVGFPIVGLRVGFEDVGSIVGSSVGPNDCEIVGLSVGMIVDGVRVRTALGITVGLIEDGKVVGFIDGAFDGFFDGLNVDGERVGEVPQKSLHTSFSHVALGLQQSEFV